jgi:hypothetical protein
MDGAVALEDGVIGEHVREAELAPGLGGRGGCLRVGVEGAEEERDQNRE